MKSNVLIIVCSALFLVFCFESAMAQFKLDGEFRPRTEYSHGYGTLAVPDQDASFFTSQRTRLNLKYKGEKIETGLSLQDVRVWGSQSQLVGNEDFAVSLHQAWAKVNFTKKIGLKLGRQELAYDNHRIFGNVGWAQQARSHDLALLTYTGCMSVHAGVAYHENTLRNDNLYYGPDAYKAMQFLWLNKKIQNVELSLLMLNNGVPLERMNSNYAFYQVVVYSQTFGPYVKYTHEDFSMEFNAYYQTGRNIDEDQVYAYEAMAVAEYKLTENLNLSLGYEVLSGDDVETPEQNAFSPFYGTNHKFNGFMDYFYVGNYANSYGLQDIFLTVGTKFDKLGIGLNAHYFASAQTLPNDLESYYGTELDLHAKYKVSPEVTIAAGYSHMIASESLEFVKGGDKDEIQNWAYLMFVFKPVFMNK